MRLLHWLFTKITKKEHKFTIKWCLVDKNTNERVEEDFVIATVGVYYKEDIHDKRSINKTLNPCNYINKRVKEKTIPKDCELSYNIICYYGYMNKS